VVATVLVASVILAVATGLLTAFYREAERQRGHALANETAANEVRDLEQAARQEIQANQVRLQLYKGSKECEAGRIDQGISWFLRAYENTSPTDPLRTSARRLLAGWSIPLGIRLFHEG